MESAARSVSATLRPGPTTDDVQVSPSRVVRNRCRYERSCVDDDYRPNSSSRWSLSNRSASATLNAPGLARTIPMKPYR